LIVIACVLNQSSGHWLLYDALNSFITWSLKMKEKTRIQTTFDPLMDDGRITFEFYLLASNIKKKVVGIFDFFLTFLWSYGKKKTYNMLSSMLDGQGLKAFVLCLHVGHEQGMSIVEKHDDKTMYLMFLKCYHYLHLVGESCRSQKWWLIRLDIFQMTNTNCEHVK